MHHLLITKPSVSKLGPPGRQPCVWPLSSRTSDLCSGQNATCTRFPPANHDGQLVALFHQAGSRLLMASCHLIPVFFSNFGVSTSKQCCSHFLAFSCRPYIRSTLYHCGRVGGGIQQMQTYTSAFEARRVLCFLIPPFPFPFDYPVYASAQLPKTFNPSGRWFPASWASGSGSADVDDAAGAGAAPSRQRSAPRSPCGSIGSGRHGARPATTTDGGREAQSP